ncbi:MAG: Mut7-C RNAse domain-containing protein [Nitrospirota bacterium]|nr:Mut7-C RNAse domain-containing protein [Nitrospirota bacterium]
MKFIADAMLGKLEKRLRLLGFDVLYDAALPDNEIIMLSRESGRTILTRDTGLASRPLAEHHLLILSDHVNEQIAQVLSAFPAPPAEEALTRCSMCNETLLPIELKDAADRIPQFIAQSKRTYLSCPVCERVYWRGTHVRRLEASGNLLHKKSRRP